MGGHDKAIEVAKTVLDVAEVAWKAVEMTHQHAEHHDGEEHKQHLTKKIDEELEALRLENAKLRELLEQNLKVLQTLAESPMLTEDCPPHLHSRLVSAVKSENFLKQLKSLEGAAEEKSSIPFPHKLATDHDGQFAEVFINVDEAPSWWVWVSEDMVPHASEERSGIDGESYVVITEEHIVDAVANFLARCITSNPKASKLSPQQLQKALAKALGGVNKLEKMIDIWHAGKLFYAFSTWGLALAGIYRSRAVLKLAAVGVHSTTKLALKML